MITWGSVINFIVNHKAVELLIITAGIKTIPNPDIPVSWMTIREWLYDWAHQFFNITNTRLNTQPTLTPPLNTNPEVTNVVSK
jgi:hypothetical protein